VATDAEIVVLGLLAGSPMHGYELIERSRSVGMPLWTVVGRASIYQALKRLERDGAVAGRTVAGSLGPRRRVFRITRAGRARLATAVAQAAARAAPIASPPATALAFAHAVPTPTARAAIDGREAALRDRLAEVREALESPVPADEADPAWATAMLRHQAALVEAELAWLQASRDALAARDRAPGHRSRSSAARTMER
jgi:DNA-binding PadR family transcriptional regulator